MTEQNRLQDWVIQLAEHGPNVISLIDETPILSSIIDDVQPSNLNSWPETASSHQSKSYPSVQNGNINKAFINLSKQTQIIDKSIVMKDLSFSEANQEFDRYLKSADIMTIIEIKSNKLYKIHLKLIGCGNQTTERGDQNRIHKTLNRKI